MSLFKKPKKNFRHRIKNSDSEGEDENRKQKENKRSESEEEWVTGSGPVLSIGAKTTPTFANNDTPKVKNVSKLKEEKVSRQSVLSFDDEEEEEEVFKVKKSTQSRRLTKLLEKERKQKKSTNHNPTPHVDENISVINENPQTTIPETIVINGEEAEEMELESEDDIRYRDPFKKIFESGAIPDAAMIHAARKRRQQAREMGDFIGLEENESQKNSHSRLVRDDENDKSDEDDDENGRLSFTVDTGARDREKVREAFLSINQQKDEESGGEDEELQRWEEEQIRKGVNIPQVVASEPVENHYYTQCYYGTPGNHMMSQGPVPTLPVITPLLSQIPSAGSNMYREQIPMKVIRPQIRDLKFEKVPPEVIKERLVSRLKSLKELNREREVSLDKVESMIDSSKSHIKELETEAQELERRFDLYQETRGYVTDLVECLNEKVTSINALESAMQNLLKQRATKLVSRRQQDIKDQAAEFSKLSSKAANPVDSWMRDRASAAEENARTRRAAEREGRRSRRRKAREVKISELKHYEGMSSDDEETEADVIRFNAERDRILRDCSGVFEDVVDDFSCIGNIKNTFEKWRDQYSDTYREAYISLCLPKLFNPLVRLQLIGWNPLQECRSFEDMEWYETLMFYCFDESSTLESLRKDPDVNLVPLVVEQVVIPKLKMIVEDVWDPMSTSQTLRLVRLIKKLVEDYPTLSNQSKTTKALLQSLATRIRQTLDEDVFIPLYPKALLENTSLNANAFFQRQFWSCVKLFHNILSWQGSLSDSLLQELALDCLLNRYILLGLKTWLGDCDVDKCHMITSGLPRTWFARLNEDNTLPQLEMFCNFLKSLANTLDSKSISVSIAPLLLTTKPGSDHRDTLKDIVKILVSIRAVNHALELANQHPTKDLKPLIITSSSSSC